MAKAQTITGLDTQASTEQNARIIAQERLAELYAYMDYIESPANIKELHDMRIAAKRLRYTLEVFADYLPAGSQEIAEELATLQDELGTLHDSEVMLALLRLSLQTTEDTAANGQAETELAAQRKALLSQEMLTNLLDTNSMSALSERERHGLEGFLHKQERRREQSYAAFLQHWEQLEQRHFRAEILTMLTQEKDEDEVEQPEENSDDHEGGSDFAL